MTQAAVPVRRRRRFARYLLKGFAVLLPVFLTGYIVMLVFRFVDSTLGYLFLNYILAECFTRAEFGNIS